MLCLVKLRIYLINEMVLRRVVCDKPCLDKKSKINCNLDKKLIMPSQNTHTQPATTTSSTTTTTTQLPGMNNVQVIVSTPQLVKENSQYSSTDKKK
jgi:hypothetical protein